MPAPPPLTRRLHRWIMRRQQASAQHLLRHRNIYVRPSGAGCMLGATLLLLLVASINFQLNLGYALTFLLAGSALASLWLGHRNLRGVHLRLGSLQPVFQGQRATVPVVLHCMRGKRARYGLSLAIHRSHAPLAWVHTDIPVGRASQVELGSIPLQRGWHRVPRMVVECRFPLGVFRLWSYWQPEGRVLVYPAPETPMPAMRWNDSSSTGHAPASAMLSSEPDGVRSYQRGDPLRSMVWKKSASSLACGSGELVVRHHASVHHHTLWLEARATGLGDTEAQIARLTAWVLHAHAQHWHWGLILPSGQMLAPASGTSHLHACLEALAVDGHLTESAVSRPRTH